MSNIAFYVVSDVHGYIFPTDFTSRNQYQPMGLLLANHVIEQDRRQFDQSFKIDNGDFCKGHHFVSLLNRSLKRQTSLLWILFMKMIVH